MPFKSEAQRRYLYATNPRLAKKFSKKTPKGKKLPERVTPKEKKASKQEIKHRLAVKLASRLKSLNVER